MSAASRDLATGTQTFWYGAAASSIRQTIAMESPREEISDVRTPNAVRRVCGKR
jgi:hypothetical protein